MSRKIISVSTALTLALGTFASLPLLSSTAQAEPGGCLKYGAAGAVAGHVANHHSVVGATGGCVVGMYQRHKFRKEARRKAALWDQEHPDTKVKTGLFHHESISMIEQKAEWYDQEHNAQPGNMGTTNGVPTATTPAAAQAK